MSSSIAEQITAIRKERGSELAILAHHYQHDDVVRHADHVGDSLELSRKIPDLAAKDIVFCGVFFMAETAALLAAPGQRVHIPAACAKCVMSEMAPAELVEAVLERLEAAGRALTPLAYVNTSVEVKAVCGARGGAVCTSANAAKMLTWARDQGRGVLFLPDKMLAQNTCNQLGIPEAKRHILSIRHGGGEIDLEAAKAAEVCIWPGQCVIHSRFKPDMIRQARLDHPGALVVVHPECAPETVAQADAAGSTSFIIRYVEAAPAGATVVIGTEINLVERLAARYRGQKTVIPLCRSSCSNMARVTEGKLLTTLQDLDRYAPVIVPVAAREAAKAAVTRMLAASA